MNQADEIEALRARVAELETALSAYETDVVSWSLPGFPDIRFTAAERQIMRVLYERRPRLIQHWGLLEATRVCGRGRKAEAFVQIVNVFICHLRRKLRLTPWRVVNEFGLGYRLELTEQHKEAA